MLKEFGLVLAIHQAYLLDTAFCQVESKFSDFPLKQLGSSFLVACALDFTFQFDWWLNREAWLNSTNHVLNATNNVFNSTNNVFNATSFL